ncbi:MAG: DnaJ domain-containing protein [Smithella sp.]|nr:DnaJ domain-containing protein [Smithella sp.]MDM7987752.1 DnaJ domain-containing protein [Smithella sp.]HOU51331.1 DnaJ domain-containing protein [Smithella sp.]HQG66145.1 DnaJ domain-containing protein [Smithella sp.]HQI73342.1 DnaJ domain-containing protein [Smithella sp.]
MNRNHEIDKAKQVLGITGPCTADAVKKHYRILAKRWHPDVNKNEEAHLKMQDVNEAYAFLMKEEFGILDPWEDYHRWWWRQYGNDPIWGNHFPENGHENTETKNIFMDKNAQPQREK